MRVLQILTWVAADGSFGGPLAVARSNGARLAENGHEVALWGGGNRQDRRSHLDGERVFPAFQIPAMGVAGFVAPRLWLELFRQRHAIDVAYVHAARDLTVVVAMMVLRALRIPYVAQPHGMVQPTRHPAKRVIDIVLLPTLRRAGAVLALTPIEARDLASLRVSEDRVVMCPNGISDESAEADGREDDLVSFVSRLHPRKRVESFVDAAAIVRSGGTQARFEIAGGDAGSLAATRERIERLGLADDVRYLGALTPVEARKQIARSSVFVLPSVDEPFPRAVLEALAVGTPVVCTTGCHIAPILADYDAAVVCEPTPDALAAAICALLDDADRRHRLREAGLRAVREQFSMDVVAERLEGAFAAAMHSG